MRLASVISLLLSVVAFIGLLRWLDADTAHLAALRLAAIYASGLWAFGSLCWLWRAFHHEDSSERKLPLFGALLCTILLVGLVVTGWAGRIYSGLHPFYLAKYRTSALERSFSRALKTEVTKQLKKNNPRLTVEAVEVAAIRPVAGDFFDKYDTSGLHIDYALYFKEEPPLSLTTTLKWVSIGDNEGTYCGYARYYYWGAGKHRYENDSAYISVDWQAGYEAN